MAGIVHDVRSRGRAHPVYVWGGLVVLVSGPVRAAFGRTAAWEALAAWLLG